MREVGVGEDLHDPSYWDETSDNEGYPCETEAGDDVQNHETHDG